MKTLHKKLVRWTRTFRGLNHADSLLLYAGSTPRAGSAVWHSHPRNHLPHVHVEVAKPDDENAEEPPHRHFDGHEHHDHAGDGHSDHETDRPPDLEHDDSHDAGHWHFVVSAARLRVSQELLAYAKCEIWVTLHDLADSAIAFSPASSARAPPDRV